MWLSNKLIGLPTLKFSLALHTCRNAGCFVDGEDFYGDHIAAGDLDFKEIRT